MGSEFLVYVSRDKAVSVTTSYELDGLGLKF
jgi:hypothetical protein